jgi:hypothetical protein
VSQDSTKPPGTLIDDKFKPVQSGELDDLHLLPGEFRAFRSEMRTAIELLTTQLIPAINRINDKLDDVGVRLNRLERDRDDLKNRVAALEQRSKQRKRK